MPPYLKKSINQAHLEYSTYEQIVTHLEKELEVNGLEDPDDLQKNTVSQQPTNTNPDRPKLTGKTRTLQKSVPIVEKTARTN